MERAPRTHSRRPYSPHNRRLPAGLRVLHKFRMHRPLGLIRRRCHSHLERAPRTHNRRPYSPHNHRLLEGFRVPHRCRIRLGWLRPHTRWRNPVCFLNNHTCLGGFPARHRHRIRRLAHRYWGHRRTQRRWSCFHRKHRIRQQSRRALRSHRLRTHPGNNRIHTHRGHSHRFGWVRTLHKGHRSRCLRIGCPCNPARTRRVLPRNFRSVSSLRRCFRIRRHRIHLPSNPGSIHSSQDSGMTRTRHRPIRSHPDSHSPPGKCHCLRNHRRFRPHIPGRVPPHTCNRSER